MIKDIVSLREFLHLNNDMDLNGITELDIQRQEKTILKSLEILYNDKRPGVMLADEVGMGKTFEALGIISCILEEKSTAKILIITPGPDLNRKWIYEISKFYDKGFYEFKRIKKKCPNCGKKFQNISNKCPQCNFNPIWGEVNHRSELVEKVHKCSITFVPLNIFSSVRKGDERKFLLNSYFKWKGFTKNTREKIDKNLPKEKYYLLEDVTDFPEKYLPYFDSNGEKLNYEDINHLFDRGVFRYFDKIYNEFGTNGFKNEMRVKNAFTVARYNILHELLPKFDLILVDEAHKLKNEWTIRSQAFNEIFTGKYKKAVFLTATPFQLHIDELKQVFRLFTLGNIKVSDKKQMKKEADDLIEFVYEYQKTYAKFEENWKLLQPEDQFTFKEKYPDFTDVKIRKNPNLSIIVQNIKKLCDLKEIIQKIFKKWIIRSIKGDKTYRTEKLGKVCEPDGKPLKIQSSSIFPFLVYERLIFERFRKKEGTFKSIVEISMTSSYKAAEKGSLLEKHKINSIREYQALLGGLLNDENESPHPKVQDAVTGICNLIIEGEKTLVFCERVRTIETLRQKINKEWNNEVLKTWSKAFPSSKDIIKFNENIRKRFNKPNDISYLTLRENYIFTITDIPLKEIFGTHNILKDANDRLNDISVSKSAIEKIDYRYIKRIVEQIVFEIWIKEKPLWAETLQPKACEIVEKILHKDYPKLGFGFTKSSQNEERILFKPKWKITAKHLKHLTDYNQKNIWYPFRDSLNELDPKSRVELIRAVRHHLTIKSCPFIPEVILRHRVKIKSWDEDFSNKFRFRLDKIWESGFIWYDRLNEFLINFIAEKGIDQSRLSQKQKDILDYGLKTDEIARDTLKGEVRGKLEICFNSSFYPMVLICNSPMQEGMDLQRQCRRLIHYDLSWNPAILEQRVGRLDRIGSLVNRHIDDNNESETLDIFIPLIDKTIDINMFNKVKEREKWLAFLLGSPPDPDEYSQLNSPPSGFLPEMLIKDLTMDLAP